ncbi:MAG TPA: glycosyl transferase family 2, partial [Candidatus Margulisbacteria bacterium]|nr:glycosyl transferase family 2 [Candidatus Margulisiibacteriota bacterium]
MRSDKPLFSIICFVKNRQQTISRCIDSLLAQDYPNIEIIVQDG